MQEGFSAFEWRRKTAQETSATRQSLTMRPASSRSMSVIAFHEKAGRSQVGSFVFSLDKVFLRAGLATDAILPSALW